MKQIFKELAGYVKAFDGNDKPELNWQEMYKLFPNFTFKASEDFGSYKNFNEAYEHKVYDMTVSDDSSGAEAFLIYKRYTDDHEENLIYLS